MSILGCCLAMCAKTQRIRLLHTEISKYFNKEGKIKAAASSGSIDNFMTFSKEFIQYVFRLFFIENEGLFLKTRVLKI